MTISGSDGPTVVLQGRRRWVALLFVAMGVSMIILDATVVNVAIPTMVESLHLTTSDAEWVNAGYSLTFASLLILFGRLADRFGRRLIFVIGVVMFAFSSALVAASESSAPLIGSRALQGIGAAMILPSSLSVINAVFVGRARAIAFAVWGGVIGGVAAIGPLVGGWLTTYASWHWAFLINIPFGAIVLIGVLRTVPETRNTEGPKGVDGPGTVLVTVGLAGLVFALIEGQRYGWFRPLADFTLGAATWPLDSVSVVPVVGLVGVITLALLLWVERARLAAGKVVVFDLPLFGIRSFGAGNAVALVVSLGEFGLLFALPLFLQSSRGYDALQTGIILLALAAGSFLASGACPRLAIRFGPVWVLRLGMTLETIGIAGLGFAVSTSITGWGLAPWLFTYGCGVGFATAQLTSVILSEVPVAQSGQASAVQSTARQVGAAIGTAVIGTTLALGLGATASELEQRGIPAATAENVSDAVSTSAGQAIPRLAAEPQGAVLVAGASAAFATAIRDVAWIAGAFVFLGLCTSFALPHTSPIGGDKRGRDAETQSVK